MASYASLDSFIDANPWLKSHEPEVALQRYYKAVQDQTEYSEDINTFAKDVDYNGTILRKQYNTQQCLLLF